MHCRALAEEYVRICVQSVSVCATAADPSTVQHQEGQSRLICSHDPFSIPCDGVLVLRSQLPCTHPLLLAGNGIPYTPVLPPVKTSASRSEDFRETPRLVVDSLQVRITDGSPMSHAAHAACCAAQHTIRRLQHKKSRHHGLCLKLP